MSKIYVDEIAGIASPSTVAIPGHVIQVVQTVSTTEATNTTTTYADSNLSGSITPSSTTSKILILISQNIYVDSNSINSGTGLRLLRGSTVIHGGVGRYEQFLSTGNSSRAQLYNRIPLSYLDSPATTSSVTYKTQIASDGAGETTKAQKDGFESTITLMEIAG